MKKAARFIVKGTVQGIFFRQFVKEHADKIGVTGFVRNLSDGDAEVVVEGEGDQLERLLSQVKKGPKHSQIRNVEVEEKKWSGSFEGFRILRF
jgi:acylphosphatase